MNDYDVDGTLDLEKLLNLHYIDDSHENKYYLFRFL